MSPLALSPFYWSLFRHDFQVCPPLSPFYWILFRHVFQVCLPLSPFYWKPLAQMTAALLTFSCCHALPLLAAAVLLSCGAPELPGPKSGLVLPSLRSSWPNPTLNLGWLNLEVWDQRGEGSTGPMACRDGVATKDHTNFPRKTHGSGREGPPGAKPPSKRSYCRALRRARTNGWTFYRGNILRSPDDENAAPPQRLVAPQLGQHRRRIQKRAGMLNWNVGGLTTPLYHEILHWLQMHQVAICTLQGIRWTGERTWLAGGYAFIQTGDPDGGSQGHAGLLTIVANTFCPFEHISFGCPIPGRLLHVKCNLGTLSCDIINGYQHPLHKTQLRPDPLAARAHFWNRLDDTLGIIPFRNILVLGGDFNCDLEPRFARNSAYPDVAELQEISKKYSLATVRTHDSQPSFVGPNGTAYIDHVPMRKCQMDGETRQGRCIKNFPLASWRVHPDHLPIVTSFPLGWKCWYQPSAKPSFPKRMHEKILDSRQQGAATWTSYVSQATQHIAQLSPDPTAVCSLLHCSESFCKKHFTLPPKPPHASESTKTVVHELWSLRRTLLAIDCTAIPALFKAWKLFAKMHKTKKILDAHCRTIKLTRIENAVTLAEKAASRHDTRKLFATVRNLCPKQSNNAIRFRGARGQALTGLEECQQLTAYFAEVYDSDGIDIPAPPVTLHTMPFTMDELQSALFMLRSTKLWAPLHSPMFSYEP